MRKTTTKLTKLPADPRLEILNELKELNKNTKIVDLRIQRVVEGISVIAGVIILQAFCFLVNHLLFSAMSHH